MAFVSVSTSVSSEFFGTQKWRYGNENKCGNKRLCMCVECCANTIGPENYCRLLLVTRKYTVLVIATFFFYNNKHTCRVRYTKLPFVLGFVRL